MGLSIFFKNLLPSTFFSLPVHIDVESPGYIFNDAVIIIFLISAALLILMYCYAKIVLVISYTA